MKYYDNKKRAIRQIIDFNCKSCYDDCILIGSCVVLMQDFSVFYKIN